MGAVHELDDLATTATALSAALSTTPATPEAVTDIYLLLREMAMRIRAVSEWMTRAADNLERARLLADKKPGAN